MKHKLINEEQILELPFRKKIIEEIKSQENVARKQEALKRYELYKDMVKKYVVEQLSNEGLKEETLVQMSNRAATVSVYKKVINKKARCYNGGAVRESKEAQKQVDQLVELLEIDQKQKNKDRYRESFKNCATLIVPERCDKDDELKYKIKVKVLSPYQYDVIEDYYDHEVPRVFVLTDFIERNQGYKTQYAPEGTDGRGVPGMGQIVTISDNNSRDEIIADSPEDQGYGDRTFIFWSKKYHFTCDKNGEIIKDKSPEDLLNPIQILPLVNMSDNPDGEFWAKGGEDLVNGAILINTMLTDLFSLAFIQGWGQMVVTGRDVPKLLEGGPHNALVLNYDAGDPEPKVAFQSANPPLQDWMRMVEQYLALLLSTNDLSPTVVAGKLEATNAASGIALLIEQSEATGSIEDKRRMFKDDENKLWEVLFAWQNYLFDNGALDEEFEEVGKIPEGAEVTVTFNEFKQLLSEKEKLENIKLRKELGINTMLDLLKIDNPELSDKEAEEKLKKILAEKIERANELMASSIASASQMPQDEEMAAPQNADKSNGEENENGEETSQGQTSKEG